MSGMIPPGEPRHGPQWLPAPRQPDLFERLSLLLGWAVLASFPLLFLSMIVRTLIACFGHAS